MRRMPSAFTGALSGSALTAGGVSAGLARRYRVDRFVMRLLMIAGVLFLSPLIYLALWVLMPADA